MNNYWSEKDIEFVQKLAMEGKSSTQIAAHFPDRTRNSVIGVCSRRGIALLVKPKRDQQKTLTKKPKKAKRKKSFIFGEGEKNAYGSLPPMPVNEEPDAPYTPLNKKILKLDFLFEQCRAILGPVKGLDTLYCGNKTVEGKSWCPHHMALYTFPIHTKRAVPNDQSEKSERR